MGRVEEGGFGEALRRRRLALGLTQEQLAERAGLSARGIQDLERGLRRSPQPETMRRLADALGIQLTELSGALESPGGPANPLATRGLAVFLVADLRGYSSYTHQHGDEAAAAAAIDFAAIVQQLADGHGGRLLEAHGERTLAIFGSARQALRVSHNLQAHPRASTKLVLPVAIGLDAGEPVPVEGGFRGEAVNVAAQLCGLAEPGQVLVSDLVVRLARRVDGLIYEECKPARLEGLDSPVRVWRIRGTNDAAAEARVDVYLCHNGQLGTEVAHIARQLQANELRAWSTRASGEGGPQASQSALSAAMTCAVLIGPNGLADWETDEIGLALDRARRDPSFRVFPVLLPGAREPFDATTLPPALVRQPWVDLRSGLDEPQAVRQLVAATRGVALGDISQNASVSIGEESPYLGLQSFEEEHAQLFFGRDADIQRLLEQLKGNRFLAVVAPSGTGKSSLVRAGLVPALRRGALPTSETWLLQLVTPGAAPLAALAAALVELGKPDAVQSIVDRLALDARTLHLSISQALSRGSAATRVVLLIDQFEEIFTQCYDQREQAQFVENLLYAGTVPGGRTFVVLTMRADFYARCAVYPELAACIATHQHLLSPMDEAGLRQTIERPAWWAGLKLEPGLAERMLDDVVGEPGALPLLEFALLELWRRRHRGVMTLDGYLEIGGVQGALARRAESIYGDLSPAEQAIAQHLLLRLIEPGDGTEDSRRRAPMTELITLGSAPDETDRVVRALADARLVVTAADGQAHERYVELAHEALIRHWPRLRQWLDDDRAALRAHRRLNESAREWQRLNREDEALLRGARLAEAVEWRQQREEDLNALERDFLDTSMAFRERERLSRMRLRRRITSGLVSGLVAAILLSVIAGVQWQKAESQRQLAAAGELAFQAEAIRKSSPSLLPRAVLLATESLRQHRSPEAEGTLRLALSLLSVPITTIHTAAPLHRVVFSPDGQWLAAASDDGVARVWDAATGAEVRQLMHAASVGAIAYDPQGRYIATASGDRTARLWDTLTGRELAHLQHLAPVYGLTTSLDGRFIATASTDGHAAVWDASTAQTVVEMNGPPAPSVRYSPDGGAHFAEAPGPSIAFSPNGHLLAVAGGNDASARVWDTSTGQQVARLQHEDLVEAVTFSPDGSLVSTGSVDGTVSLWNASTGERLTQMVADRRQAIYNLAFSPDGRALVGSGFVYNVRVWEIPSGNLITTLPHNGSGDEEALAFSPDGRSIATAEDNTVHVWDSATGREVARAVAEDSGAVYSIAFSFDGRSLATGGAAGIARTWQAASAWELAGLSHPDTVTWVDFSPDGRFLATASADGNARLWDTANGAEVVRLNNDGGVEDVAFSPDGRLLATASDDGTAREWEVPSGAERFRIVHTDRVLSVAFSGDGHLLATGTRDRTVRVFEAASGQEVAHMTQGASAVGLAFSRDARILASSSQEGTVRIWDPYTGTELSRVSVGDGIATHGVSISPDGRYVAAGDDHAAHVWESATMSEVARLGHDSPIYGVVFSPDGRYLATTSIDGTVDVWEWASGQEVARVAHEAGVFTAAFSPDGRQLATGGDDRTARIWTVDPANLLGDACNRVMRNLTLAEWRLYVHEDTYRKTCPGVP